jgi:hypothetical protein
MKFILLVMGNYVSYSESRTWIEIYLKLLFWTFRVLSTTLEYFDGGAQENIFSRTTP